MVSKRSLVRHATWADRLAWDFSLEARDPVNRGNKEHDEKGDRVAALIDMQRKSGVCETEIKGEHAENSGKKLQMELFVDTETSKTPKR